MIQLSKNNKRAFTLMELSIAIIIVAVLIGAIATTSIIMEKSQEIFSESSTTNSTVTSVEKLKVWLETTNSDSFDKDEYENGGEITNWYDKTPSSVKINAVSTAGESGTRPSLAKTQDLKKILNFSRDGYFLIDGDFFNSSNYAVFVVAATRGSDTCDSSLSSTYCLDNFFIGEDDTSSEQSDLRVALGYKYNGAITQSHGGLSRSQASSKAYYTVSGSTSTSDIDDYYTSSLSDLKIYSFTHSQHFGNKTYEDGNLIAQDDDTSHVSNIGQLAIGKNFDGQMGEIIIYATNIDERQRHKVEDYLSQKWGIKISRVECLTGVVTDGECAPGCSVDEVGVSETLVSSGDGGFSCDTGNGFVAETLTYECDGDNDSIVITGACDCPSGSTPSGGVCISATCSLSINGITDTTLADGASETFTCSGTEYDTLDTIDYSCSSGALTYTGAEDEFCSCASGYANSTLGDPCDLGCTVGSIAGTTVADTTVTSGTVVTCDDTGYDDSTLGTCSPSTAISGSCGCADGYNDNGGVCEAQCSLALADSGLDADIDIDSGDSTYTCSSYGGGSYTGSLTFASACSDGSALSVSTGSCSEESASDTFITSWKTDNTGTSGDTQITLPLISGGTYDFDVDWGDESSTTGVTSTSPLTHTYASADTYTVTISGNDFTGFNFDAGGDKAKLLNISQWGIFSFGSSASKAFRGASNLTITATDIPTNTAALTDLYRAFSTCSLLTTIPSLDSWDVSNVTNMKEMFVSSTSFNQDLNSWNTISATNMSSMFNGATAFNGNISSWTTDNVIDMSQMFYDAAAFNQDLDGWNVTNVTTMEAMFRNAAAFSQDLSSWTTTSLTNVYQMFYSSDIDFDLSQWDYADVTNFSQFLQNVTLSTVNWSNLMINWAAEPSIVSGVSINVINSKHNSAGAVAKADLEDNHSWTITDGGGEASCTSDTDSETTYGSDTLHTFTTSGSHTLTCSGSITAQILVVGGGGGGGRAGGGGGAGVVSESSVSLSATPYSLSVGAGGGHAVNGSVSTFYSYTAFGGGYGANGGGGSYGGVAGASSGGNSYDTTGTPTTAGSQGYAGGISDASSYGAPAGGGGAGGVGGNGGTYISGASGGDGGIGVTDTITGSSLYYGAGGGGGANITSGTIASGGNGGSGVGGQGSRTDLGNGFDASANTGSGGGGAESSYGTAGSGADGIVIIRYPTP